MQASIVFLSLRQHEGFGLCKPGQRAMGIGPGEHPKAVLVAKKRGCRLGPGGLEVTWWKSASSGQQKAFVPSEPQGKLSLGVAG